MSKEIRIGALKIGAGNPIAIQSMLNIHNSDVSGNVAQAVALEHAGCDIIRVAVPNDEAVRLIPAIKQAVAMPVVADIHFDYRLAIESVLAGADKIRINPGNIGSPDRLRAVVECCGEHAVPIRVGVNSGSLEKDLLEKYGSPTAEALCESALRSVKQIESCGYDNIVVAVKSSDLRTMTGAVRLLSGLCGYPLHLGVTEAGGLRAGLIKSAIGIGSLLMDGIGDTIRVSLTGDPAEEISAARDILKALGLRRGVEVVSCPTCGRTEIDLISIASEVERRVKDMDKDIKVAVMGCVVNGPGEAREADIGLAGGRDCALLFKKGEIIRRINGDYVEELIREIEKL